MDDTQQPQSAPAGDTVATMNDVAGMTPPPAPVMPNDQPQVDESMTQTGDTTVQAAPSAAGQTAPVGDMPTEDDYSYAEDVLNEILDSLDRIEARLDAMEKKMG